MIQGITQQQHKQQFRFHVTHKISQYQQWSKQFNIVNISLGKHVITLMGGYRIRDLLKGESFTCI